MQILVTGGAGFIGSHIVEHHLNRGDAVHVVDDLSTGKIEHVELFKNNPNFTFSEADILTWQDLEKSVGRADWIYHMAAVVGVYRVIAEPIKVLATNIAGCERVLRAAAASSKKPRILIASSSEVYGPSQALDFKETDDLIIEVNAQNRWNYAISKLADEAFGLSYAKKMGLPITIVRLFNTIGPRQTGRYGMVVPRFVEQAIKGEAITVYGDGKQTRSFCDVRDTIRILELLMNMEQSIGEIVNVGNDNEISINALADLVRRKVNLNIPIKHISYEEAYGEPYKDIMRRKPNIDKLMSLTHYKYHWTLERSIENLIKDERQ